MTEIIAVIVVGVLSFCAGWITREREAVRRVNYLIKTATEQVEKTVIRINIEYLNEVYYVYNMDDKSFMAHGATLKELETTLANKFPGKTFAASQDNLIEVGIVNESV